MPPTSALPHNWDDQLPPSRRIRVRATIRAMKSARTWVRRLPPHPLSLSLSLSLALSLSLTHTIFERIALGSPATKRLARDHLCAGDADQLVATNYRLAVQL